MIYFFLFSCFIRDACTAVRVAQRVCVYEWTFIYISGIVIANIYWHVVKHGVESGVFFGVSFGVELGVIIGVIFGVDFKFNIAHI
jgi:hypothetical protein